MSKNATQPTPGFSCLVAGGIFVPNMACDPAEFENLNFNQTNAYYAWKRLIIDGQGNLNPSDPNDLPLARGYVSDQTTQSAVNWIRQQNADGQTWMATVAYANDHTPYQQPPLNLIPPSSPDALGLTCADNNPLDTIGNRVISNLMIEAMDSEIGTLLVQSGLATMDSAGNLQYNPSATNTMVVIIGDNGTFAPGVKIPFDPNRSKGYVYQTGVWVPLIIAGPLVASPGRQVTSMVNIADLFQLWGEFAGVDVHKVVPKSHILDSQSMLPYLTKVNQKSIRQTNFTQTSSNIHVLAPPPCVLDLTSPPTCVQLFNQRQICDFEGGDWYGSDSPAGGVPYNTCCDVQRANIYKDNAGNPVTLSQLPIDQVATRNDQFKLVKKTVTICGPDPSSDANVVQTELYPINEDETSPLIDKDGDSICGENCPAGLKGANLATYNSLAASMNATLSSQPACPGDGNEDMLVNNTDVTNWAIFNAFDLQGEGSSWYDFNHDGQTDNTDLTQYILPNLGKNCLKNNNGNNGNGNGQ